MSTANLVLIGMMGSGKSLIGRALAEELARDFVDTDTIIEQETAKTIEGIFRQDGEEVFRRIEAQIIAKVASRRGQVIATGGGVILKWENIKHLKTTGVIIFLKTSSEVLVQRLANDQSRPLLKGNVAERIKELLTYRAPLYQQAADFQIVTDDLTPAEIVDIIKSKYLAGQFY